MLHTLASCGVMRFGKRPSNSSCGAVLKTERWIRVLSTLAGLVEACTGTSLLCPFCTWRKYAVFQPYHFLSLLQLSEATHSHKVNQLTNLPWDQWEPFHWRQSRAFHAARGELGLFPNSIHSNIAQQIVLTTQSPFQTLIVQYLIYGVFWITNKLSNRYGL